MQGMTKIEALIPQWKLEPVRDSLLEAGVEAITLTEVVSYSRHEPATLHFRGQRLRHPFQSKFKLEIVLLDDMVERVVQAISAATRNGEAADGSIVLSRILDAVRIRNGNQGVAAL
jgi:nitrogen regulatory protein P-II 1